MACKQCAAVGALFCLCAILFAPGRLHSPILHAPDAPSLTVPFLGPALRVYVLASDRRRVLRLVRALDSAVYPVGLAVHLTIVNATPVHVAWGRGECRFGGKLAVANSTSPAIILSDTMEISPFYALWFLRHACVSVGGGDLHSPAGVGFRGGVQGEFGPLGSLLRRILAARNCSAVFPADRVFVREGWQNALLPERSPRLERAWDLKL